MPRRVQWGDPYPPACAAARCLIAMDRKNDLVSTILTVSLLVLIAVQLLTLRAPAQSIDYSDFRRLVAARQVDDLEITPTQITGSVHMPGAGPLLTASAAQALTRCKQVPSGPRLPRKALPSIGMWRMPSVLQTAWIQDVKASWKASGSSAAKTRLKVS